MVLRLAILVLASLAACSAAGPDTPVAHEVPPGPAAAADPEPKRVEPRAGMANVRPHPFESATPIGDETSLDVRFWGGVAPCFVLDRVEVAEAADSVTVTLFAGSDPAHPDTACIEIALWMGTEVRLGAPLGGRAIRDGAAPDPPG
jgi:hypothetical protein